MNKINRPKYLKILTGWKDKTDIVKIITGIRRAGKSYLFKIYQDYLIQNSVAKIQIQDIDYEDPEILINLTTWKKLYDHIKSKIISNKMNYIFLDEIQVLPDFQLAVNALRKLPNIDLYLTGSNSAILSGELATRLSGRYIEINILPLSFLEYVTNYPFQNHTLEEKFNNYIHNSGFPYTMRMTDDDSFDKSSIKMLISGIWNTVIIKDIIERNKIREIERLNNVIRFLFHSIGSEISISKIVKSLKSNGTSINFETIESWLNGLLNTFILYKANKYNIKGKQLLKTNAKYYAADIGLRYFLLGGENDIGHILENIVYLELKRRNYDNIYIGKIDSNEVDFIAKRGSSLEYYQVTYTLNTKKIMDREYKPLNAIPDHHLKFILTYDKLFPESINGIKILNILDWLIN